MPNKGTKTRTRIRWNRGRKNKFIEALYEQGSVKGALAATGMARTSAYLQRRMDPHFADEWGRAMYASQERLIDDATDAVHHGREVEVRGEGGTIEIRREPVSERLQAAVLAQAAKAMGAYQAAREANPDEDIAARRRVRIGLKELAKRLGILL